MGSQEKFERIQNIALFSERKKVTPAVRPGIRSRLNAHSPLERTSDGGPTRKTGDSSAPECLQPASAGDRW
jgi:hypothetical protein